MKRLTRDEVQVEEPGRYFGAEMVQPAEMLSDREWDLILNGPTIHSVSKAQLRGLVRELYAALWEIEDGR